MTPLLKDSGIGDFVGDVIQKNLVTEEGWQTPLGNEPLIKLKNVQQEVQELESTFLLGCLILSCKFALLFS